MSVPTKKYYWLKQPATFFQDPKIKKLRKIAGGDTYTIIYQKIMLLSIVNGGLINFEGIENTLEKELALILDEDEDNIRVTLAYMQSQNLIENLDDGKAFLLPQVPALIGSECDSAERVRKLRDKKKKSEEVEALQCNTQVTLCNTKIHKELELKKEKKTRKPIPTKVETKDDSVVITYPRYSTSRRFVSHGAP